MRLLRSASYVIQFAQPEEKQMTIAEKTEVVREMISSNVLSVQEACHILADAEFWKHFKADSEPAATDYVYRHFEKQDPTKAIAAYNAAVEKTYAGITKVTGGVACDCGGTKANTTHSDWCSTRA